MISTSVAAEILDVLVIPQSGAFGSGRTGQSHSGVAPRQAPRSYSMLNAFPDALAAACGMWICGYEMWCDDVSINCALTLTMHWQR